MSMPTEPSTERGRHGLNNTEVADPGRVGFVAKKSHPAHVRRDLLEEIQPFSAEIEIEDHEASYVAPRSGQAVNDASTDRIGNIHEHDRHRAGELLDCNRPVDAREEDDIRRQRE